MDVNRRETTRSIFHTMAKTHHILFNIIVFRAREEEDCPRHGILRISKSEYWSIISGISGLGAIQKGKAEQA